MQFPDLFSLCISKIFENVAKGQWFFTLEKCMHLQEKIFASLSIIPFKKQSTYLNAKTFQLMYSHAPVFLDDSKWDLVEAVPSIDYKCLKKIILRDEKIINNLSWIHQCTELEELSMPSHQLTSNETLSIANSCPNLRKLKTQLHADLAPENIAFLRKKCGQLISFTIENNPSVGILSMDDLDAFLKFGPKLKTFILKNPSLISDKKAVIFQNQETLHTLALDIPDLTDVILLNLCSHVFNLQHLSLSSTIHVDTFYFLPTVSKDVILEEQNMISGLKRLSICNSNYIIDLVVSNLILNNRDICACEFVQCQYVGNRSLVATLSRHELQFLRFENCSPLLWTRLKTCCAKKLEFLSITNIST